jgi:group I intron endonuclease
MIHGRVKARSNYLAGFRVFHSPINKLGLKTIGEKFMPTQVRTHRAGIYLITCTANGSTYVGQSHDLATRCSRHLSELRLHKHKNKHLQALYDNYGEDSLVFSVLKTLDPETKRRFNNKQIGVLLTPIEQVYMSTLVVSDVNQAKWADCPARGNVHSPESIEQGRLKRIGRKDSPETRARKSKAMLGKRHTEESKQKSREKHLGKKMSPESIAKMIAYRTGRKHSQEHVQKRVEGIARTVLMYYQPTDELIEVKNISDYAKKNGLEPGCLSQVSLGNYYTHKGFYLKKEYYLDKVLWETDYPAPKSEFPCVNWSRPSRKWAVAVSVNNKKKHLGYFTDEREAYQVVLDFRVSLNSIAQEG